MENKKTTLELLRERFLRLYKNCEPLAFQLDGFTHNVYFLDYEDLKVKKEESSDYMSASERNFYDEMTDRCKMLFLGLPNYAYQNNAQEIIIHYPEEIETLKQRHKINNLVAGSQKQIQGRVENGVI